MKINWTLMAKVFAGEAEQDEINALDRWSLQNEKNKQLKNMLNINWESIKAEDGEIRVDTDQAWMNVRDRLEKDNLLSGPAEPAGKSSSPSGLRLRNRADLRTLRARTSRGDRLGPAVSTHSGARRTGCPSRLHGGRHPAYEASQPASDRVGP